LSQSMLGWLVSRAEIDVAMFVLFRRETRLL
jgi:hypothetical protein